jgi:uncharacterized protein (DUF2164 family)
MKKFFLDNFKYIIFFISFLILIYIIYSLVNGYLENKIEEKIKDKKEQIVKLEKDVIYWRLKSERLETESKDLRTIIEKSKQNITTIINKYDEKRSDIDKLNDDESIKFLSNKLGQKDSNR